MSGIALRASPRFTLVIMGAHAAAAAGAWVSLGAAGAAVAALVMVAGMAAARERGMLLARNSAARLEFTVEGDLRIVDRNGRDWYPEAGVPRFVCRWFVIIALRGPATPVRRLLVARDMLPPGWFRRLRIWALWGPAARVS